VVKDAALAARAFGHETASSPTRTVERKLVDSTGRPFSLDTPPPATPDGLTRSVATGRFERAGAAPVAAPRVPEQLGPYRVLGRIGEGGMGVVFRGHDPVLDRPVALKVLSRSRDARVSDLEREARAVASVTHPNVVQIYAAGEQDGLAYFAMELVQGPDLREVLEREGPLGEIRARAYLVQAASGLRAAARKGIFHRDVKPGNLLLDRREDRVKVADFGLAGRASVDASLGGTSLIAGTPLYVAPEVIREGDGDERSDIYSLGATFFHLFTGEPPFGSASAADALVGHATRPAPDVRSVRPEVSDSFARAIARMLEKDPRARFASYEELLAELERPVPLRVPAPVPVPVPVPAPAPVPVPIPVSIIRRAPHPPRRARFFVLLVIGLSVLGFARLIHERNVRHRLSRALAEFEDGVEGLEQKFENRHPREESFERDLREMNRSFVERVPSRERFSHSCEPGFAQVAWITRKLGVNAFPDELSPCSVDTAWPSGAARPLAQRCEWTQLPFAIAGPQNSPKGIVAWHVHDLRARTVLYIDQTGNEKATSLFSFLAWLRRQSDASHANWGAVVGRVKPFLPRDASAELEQVDESF
jgi:serine/threonine protein kinase